jgi:hypothetical protein
MDIDKVFPGTTINERKMRLLALSYRRYGHLTALDQKTFNKYKGSYDPRVRSLAMYIAKTLGKPLKERHFKRADKIFNKVLDMISVFLSTNPYITGVMIKDKYLIKELLFQGFKPITPEEYTRRLSINKRYGFISTCRPIGGNYYIYPTKFADDYTQMLEGKYPYYLDRLSKIGISGITKYNYSLEGLPF